MEALQKYWWVVLLVVGVVVLAINQKKSGLSVSQISSGTDNAALAGIASQEAQQENQNRLSLIGTLLGYVSNREDAEASFILNREQMANNLQLAEINAESVANQTNANNSLSQYLANLQYQQQLAAIRAMSSNQRRTDYFNLIGTGLQSLTPLLSQLFGGGGLSNIGTGGGGYGGYSVPTFPSGSGSWWDWF